MKKSFLAIFFCAGLSVSAQTGYDVELWLKADQVLDGSMPADNTNITQWKDWSSQSNDFLQYNTAAVPVYRRSGSNFQPSVRFQTMAKKLVSQNNFPIDEGKIYRSYYVVSENFLTGTAYGSIFAYRDNQYEGWQGLTSANYLYYYGGTPAGYTSVNPGTNTKRYGIISIDRSGSVWHNAAPATGAARPFTGVATRATIGVTTVAGATNPFYGDIQEIIIISKPANTPFTAMDHQIMTSYLAIKYGHALNQSNMPDLYNSAETMVWTSSNHTGYTNNVFGIGRDDATGLYQKQAESREDKTLTTFLDNQLYPLNVNNGGTLSDMTYMLLGSNGLTGMTPYIWAKETPYSNLTIDENLNIRLSAVYNAQVTGAASVTTSFQLNSYKAKYLMVSSAPDFIPGNTTLYLLDGNGIARNVEIADGDYIGFALLEKMPGGITNANVVAWLTSENYNNGVWLNLMQQGVGNFSGAATAPRKLNTTGYNYHPIVLFEKPGANGSAPNQLLSDLPIDIATTESFTTIFVLQRRVTTSLYYDFLMGVTNTDNYNAISWRANNHNLTYTWPGTTSRALGAVEKGLLSVGNVNVTATAVQEGIRCFKDGVQTNFATAQWNGTTNRGNGRVALGGGRNSQAWYGYRGMLQEVILIKRTDNQHVDAIDMQKIHSYLAVKYGIMLQNNDDYINTAGNIVWSRSANTGYNNNIFGIARDETTGLYQRQAINSDDSVLIVFRGNQLYTLNSQNPETLNNMTYLLLGSNNQEGITDYTPANMQFENALLSHETFATRQQRLYKAQLTGDDSDITVSLLIQKFKAKYVIVSNTTNFIPSDTRIYAVNDGIATGVKIEDGDYIGFVIDGSMLNYTVELWFDANNMRAGSQSIDGMSVTRWANQSGTMNDLVRNGTQNVPIYKDEGMNFQPAVRFAAPFKQLVTEHNFQTYANTGRVYRTFYVSTANLTGTTAYGALFSYRTGANLDEGWRGATNNDYLYFSNGTVTNFTPGLTTTTGASKRFGIVSMDRNGYVWHNAKQATPAPGTARPVTAGSARAVVGNRQAGASSNPFYGDIQEIIVLSAPAGTPFAPLDMAKINTYLAVKYGQMLDTIAQPQWIAFDGTVIWDKDDPDCAGYSNNIFGIGRDDAIGLYQKQSLSVDGSEKVIVFLGNSQTLPTLNSQNNGTLNDGQYLMIGSNGIIAGNSTKELFDHPEGEAFLNTTIDMKLDYRHGTIFKAHTIGCTSMTVNIGAGRLKADYMIVSDDPTFPTSSTDVYKMDNSAIVHDILIRDNDYFCFAYQAKGPGGVLDTRIWLKADEPSSLDFVDGEVQEWRDFGTFNSRDRRYYYMAPVTTNARPGFRNVDPDMNFHPAVDFRNHYDDYTGDDRKFEYLSTDSTCFSVPRPPQYTLISVVHIRQYGWYSNGAECSYIFGFGSSNAGASLDIGNSGADTYRRPGFGFQINTQNRGVGRSYFYNAAVNGVQALYNQYATLISMNFGNVGANQATSYLRYEGDGEGETMGNNAAVYNSGNNTLMNGPGMLGGGSLPARALIGTVGEVIMFERLLDEPEKDAIYSYLGLKYGVTVDKDKTNPLVNFDYHLADGTLVWAGNSDPLHVQYHHNVAAIVRDDLASLNNRQAHSTDAGAAVVMGIGERIGISPQLSGLNTDKEIIIWGNNGGDYTSLTYSVTPGEDALCGDFEEMLENRIWMVNVLTQENYNVIMGAYRHSGAIDNFPYDGPGWKVYLIIADSEAKIQTRQWDMVFDGVFVDGMHQFNLTFEAGKTYYFTFGGTQLFTDCDACDVDNRLNPITFTTQTWPNRAVTRNFNLNNYGLTATMTANFEQPGNSVFVSPSPNATSAALSFARKGNPRQKMITTIELDSSAMATFDIKRIGGGGGRYDNLKIYGTCGYGTRIPKMSYATTPQNSTYIIHPNLGTAIARVNSSMSISNQRGWMKVQFEEPVNKIFIEHTISGGTSTATRYLAIGGPINFTCPFTPPPINEDGINLSQQAGDRLRDTVLLCQYVTYTYCIQNVNCREKTANFTVTLPNGMKWLPNSIALATENIKDGVTNIHAYNDMATLTIDSLVATGNSTTEFSARAYFDLNATEGSYTNRARIDYQQWEGGAWNPRFYESCDAFLSGCRPSTIVALESGADRLKPLEILNIEEIMEKVCFSPKDTISIAITVRNPNTLPISETGLGVSYNEDFQYLDGSLSSSSITLGDFELYDDGGGFLVIGSYNDELEAEGFLIPPGEHIIIFQVIAPETLEQDYDFEGEPIFDESGNPIFTAFGMVFDFFSFSDDECAITIFWDAFGELELEALPTVLITGDNVICVGEMSQLSRWIGGTWTSNDPAIATVDELTGEITGVSGGKVTFSFTTDLTGCVAVSDTLTVNEPNISGAYEVFVGETIIWSPTTGGTWESSDPAIATVTDGGVVTGVAIGKVVLTYTFTATGCTSKSDSISVVAPYKPNSQGVFEIWNWDDLAHVMYVQERYPDATYAIMQNIGTPGGFFKDENDADTNIPNFGDGTGLADRETDVQNVHLGDKRFGWWGYEGFITDDDTTEYDETDADYETDIETRITIAETLYSEYEKDNDDCGWMMTVGEGWIPIGYYTSTSDNDPFVGEFTGQGFAVSGLWIDREAYGQGLFGYVIGATIDSLGVNIDTIRGNSGVGGVVGGAENTTITHCYATGNIEVAGTLGGGLVGELMDNSLIHSCYSTVNVAVLYNHAGGLVGTVEDSEINNCYTTGNVEGNNFVGGIVGSISDSEISNCYTTSVVEGEDYVGGIVGTIAGVTTIENCFAFNVRITAPAAHFVGRISGNGQTTLTNNYALNCLAAFNNTDSNDGITIPPLPVLNTNGSAFAITGNWGGDFDDYWIYNYIGYNVVTAGDTPTNLPVLKAFTAEDFSGALQPPHLDVYRVTYHANGGGGAMPPSTDYYCKNNMVSIYQSSGFARLNYVFLGWALSSSATEPYYVWTGSAFEPESYFYITEDTDLYAIWKVDDCEPMIGSILVFEQPTCGNDNGSIQVLINRSNGDYLYDINGEYGILPESGIITGLPAGFYNIVITDAGNCDEIGQTLTLTNKNVSATVEITNIADAGDCEATDGEITFEVTGATIPYYYQINDEVPAEVNDDFPVTVYLGIGEYTLTVIDGGCEIPVGTFTIRSADNELTFNLTMTEQADCSGNLGELTINITAGDPKEYRINNGKWTVLSTTEIPLPAGYYEVELRDESGCISQIESETVTNSDAEAFTAELKSSAPTTCGQGSGNIELKITGDEGKYYYSFDLGKTKIPFTTTTNPYMYEIENLSAGIYTVTLSNDDGCTFEIHGVEIEQGGSEQVDIVSISVLTQPTCGNADGSIKLVVTGGGAYEYSLNGGGWNDLDGSGIIGGLSAGNYTVTVQVSGGGCSDASQTLALTNSGTTALIAITTITDAPNCDGEGSIVFTATDVTIPYYYYINDETPTQVTDSNPVTITGIAIGDHTLTIVDAGCDVPVGGFTIRAADDGGMAFTLDEEATAICGVSNGILKITITAGEPTDYRINSGAWIAINSDKIYRAVPAGSYDVELRSDEDCITQVKTQVITNDATTFSVSAGTTYSAGCGLSNGSAGLTITGGLSPYYYSLDGGVSYKPLTAPYAITGLGAGFHDIFVKDDEGCVVRIYGVEIGQGSSETVDIVSISVMTQPTCGNADGSIKLVVTGGSAYEYSLNGGGWDDLDGSGIIGGLSAGNYTVTVQVSGGGCNDVSQTLALTNSGTTALVAITTITDAPNCDGEGSIIFTATDVTIPYYYYIDDEIPTQVTDSNPVTVSGISIGDHTLTIVDGGCDVPVGGFTIRAADDGGMAFTLDEEATAICGASNGILKITITTGEPTDYRINSGAWIAINSDEIYHSVPAGSYDVELRSDEDCITQVKTQVITNDATTFSASAGTTYSAGCGLSNGSANLTITGGVSPYSYSLDGGVSYKPLTAPYAITGLGAGFHDIYVKDDEGCVVRIYGVEIGQGSSETVDIVSISVMTQPTCGNSDGSIKLVVTGGGAYEYSLNGGGWDDLDGSGIIGGLSAGNYTVTVQVSGGGCSDVSHTLALTNSGTTAIIAITTITDAPNCDGKGSIIFTATDVTIPYYYYINDETPTQVTDNNPVTVSEISIGDHTLTIVDGGCDVPVGGFTIRAADDGGMAFTLDEEATAICGVSNGILKITITAGEPTDYRINSGAWIAINSDEIYRSVPAGSYDVELRSDEDCITQVKTQVITNDATTFSVSAGTTYSAGCGLSNGSAGLTITGGLSPYYYSLDGGVSYKPLTAPYAITGLGAGFHDIFVKDDEGCVVRIYGVEIGQGSSETVDIVSISVMTQPTCGNNDGSIKLVVTGGGAYEYSLNGGGWDDLDGSGIIGGLSAGNYTVTVQVSGGGCSDVSQTLALTNSGTTTLIAITTITDAPNCDGEGSIIFTATDVTIPYYYYIDDEIPTQVTDNNHVTIGNIAIGDHTLTIVDGGCDVPVGGFIIRAADDGGMAFTLDEEATAICGVSNGILKITITAGEPTDYRINSGAWIAINSDEIYHSVPAGSYDVELRSDEDCITQVKTQVITNDATTFSVTSATTYSAGCGLSNGSANLTITGGVSPYYYSLDGGVSYKPLTAPYAITGLGAGFHDVFVKDDEGCVVRIYGIEIGQGNSGTIAPPEAISPQIFCDGATVADLLTINQKDVLWYDSETGGTPFPETEELVDGVYYVEQISAEGCARERTAVTVIINNNVVIDAPDLPYEVELCAPATLADVPTNGNTNIVWFDRMTDGSQLPSDMPLVSDTTTLYAALKFGGGACFSVQRREVNIYLTGAVSAAPEMDTPQHFCEGALIANLAIPNDQIVWYSTSTGGVPLLNDAILIEGFYYAAQKAGSCESATRTSVEVVLDQYPAPIAPPTQTTCNGKIVFVSDLMVIGVHIKWYDDHGNEITSPETTLLENETTYWAAQAVGICESDRTPVFVTAECYSPKGTISPFVHTVDDAFNTDVVVLAKLYTPPPPLTLDKIGYIRKQTPLLTIRALYYDCNVDDVIVGAPKHPGIIGNLNNPGLSIKWSDIGKISGVPNTAKLTLADRCPTAPLGWFILEDIAPDEYILEISRQGFLTRYAEVHITDNAYLEHRELVGGDVNGDMKIDEKDYSAIRSKEGFIGNGNYDLRYDLTGDKGINSADFNVIRINFGAHNTIYQETKEWVNP
ncbi:MAG: hypothetical protein FWG84_00115 [Bacteroidales bacterium]|nr:hypothetical protein [Bacteroidales bacterium]